jgi:ligand-binding SRPBCC domain-containing protein
MKLSFNCPLEYPSEFIVSNFNESLFRSLAPPFPSLILHRFDGTSKGDKVELSLDFIFFKWDWSSLITESEKSDTGLTFVDEGTILPPFLSYWRHTHTVGREKNTCFIRDEIQFNAGKYWPSFLVMFMVWIQMAPRKFLYRKYFRHCKTNS